TALMKPSQVATRLARVVSRRERIPSPCDDGRSTREPFSVMEDAMRASLDFRRGLRTSLGLFVLALLGLSVGCASVNKPASADLESGSGLRARLAAQNEETGSPQLEATADEAAEAADQAGEAADANADAVRAQMDANEAE